MTKVQGKEFMVIFVGVHEYKSEKSMDIKVQGETAHDQSTALEKSPLTLSSM